MRRRCTSSWCRLNKPLSVHRTLGERHERPGRTPPPYSQYCAPYIKQVLKHLKNLFPSLIVPVAAVKLLMRISFWLLGFTMSGFLRWKRKSLAFPTQKTRHRESEYPKRYLQSSDSHVFTAHTAYANGIARPVGGCAGGLVRGLAGRQAGWL